MEKKIREMRERGENEGKIREELIEMITKLNSNKLEELFSCYFNNYQLGKLKSPNPSPRQQLPSSPLNSTQQYPSPSEIK